MSVIVSLEKRSHSRCSCDHVGEVSKRGKLPSVVPRCEDWSTKVFAPFNLTIQGGYGRTEEEIGIVFDPAKD
jgi:hypothetical protein